MAAGKKKSPSDVAATNRKARRDYQVIEDLEAGIQLQGTEVKSVRNGHISLDEGFAKVERGQVYLFGVHIQPYEFGNVHNHEAIRPRKLLLHRQEINRLSGKIAQKGLTLIPLKVYFKRGIAKVLLGLCKGKDQQDKREDIKQRTADREAQREISSKFRR